MFAGLMSRCRMPRPWAAASALATWMPRLRTSRRRQRARLEVTAQRAALDQLHDQVRRVAVPAQVEHLHRRWMLQAGQRARLGLEPRAERGEVEAGRPHHLERDVAREPVSWARKTSPMAPPPRLCTMV